MFKVEKKTSVIKIFQCLVSGRPSINVSYYHSHLNSLVRCLVIHSIPGLCPYSIDRADLTLVLLIIND